MFFDPSGFQLPVPKSYPPIFHSLGMFFPTGTLLRSGEPPHWFHSLFGTSLFAPLSPVVGALAFAAIVFTAGAAGSAIAASGLAALSGMAKAGGAAGSAGAADVASGVSAAAGS